MNALLRKFPRFCNNHYNSLLLCITLVSKLNNGTVVTVCTKFPALEDGWSADELLLLAEFLEEL